MEDALVRGGNRISGQNPQKVLILVVMEDALVPLRGLYCGDTSDYSLNPCCNGRCTRTRQREHYGIFDHRRLNPCCNGRCTRTAKLGLCFV